MHVTYIGLYTGFAQIYINDIYHDKYHDIFVGKYHHVTIFMIFMIFISLWYLRCLYRRLFIDPVDIWKDS